MNVVYRVAKLPLVYNVQLALIAMTQTTNNIVIQNKYY
jgi:hypothetical protein